MEPSEKQGKTAALKALKQYPRGHAMAAGVLLGCLCLAVIALPSQEAAASRQSLDVELPLASSPLVMESDHPFALTMPDVAEPNLPESWEEELPLTRETFTIQSGDSLSRLFSRRSEDHTSELQSRGHLVCRLLLEKKKKKTIKTKNSKTKNY